jgi:hypothetical protein
MPGACAIDRGEPTRGAAARRGTLGGARRATLPAPPLGHLALGIGRILVLEPFAPGVELPRANLGFDGSLAGQPQRINIDQHIHLAHRLDEHVARRLRLDWSLQRELTC